MIEREKIDKDEWFYFYFTVFNHTHKLSFIELPRLQLLLQFLLLPAHSTLRVVLEHILPAQIVGPIEITYETIEFYEVKWDCYCVDEKYVITINIRGYFGVFLVIDKFPCK